MIGGAPVSQEYADTVGADLYAEDAAAAANLAKTML
jgi:5-methyltetrahydrofolate--homocysteine methyltransferase